MDVYSKPGLSRVAHERGPSWQRGQTLVLVALFIVIFFGFLALVVDLGNIYSQRRFMQNAADAGALAGARALALEESNSTIVAEANRYSVQLNKAQKCSTQVLTSSVVVTAEETFRTFFAAAIGVPQFTVSAVAEAGFGPPEKMGDLMPLAIKETAMNWVRAITEPTEIDIWDDDKVESDPALHRISDGERGWLDFTGQKSGAQALKQWIADGYQGTVSVGEKILGMPGDKASVLDEFQVHVDEQDEVIVPIFDTYDGTFYHITGFAVFKVTGFDNKGPDKHVTGLFIERLTVETAGEGIEFGVRVVHLKR